MSKKERAVLRGVGAEETIILIDEGQPRFQLVNTVTGKVTAVFDRTDEVKEVGGEPATVFVRADGQGSNGS